MLRFGKISELGTGEYLGYCRVWFDEVDMVSAWIPLPSSGTKTVKHWKTIEVGSQVACLMDRECEQGVVLAALWSNDDTPPEWANDKTLGIEFFDGAKFYYDHEAHKAILEAPESSLSAVIKDAYIEASETVELKCNSLKVTGNVNVTGDMSVSGEIEGFEVTAKSKEVKLSSHMHPTAATGSPSPPTPGT